MKLIRIWGFKRENNSQKPAPKKLDHFIYYPFTNHYSHYLEMKEPKDIAQMELTES